VRATTSSRLYAPARNVSIARRSAAEEVAEQILEPGPAATAGGGAATAGGEAGTATRHRPDRVVLLTLLGVGENRVGLTDFLEPPVG